MLKLFTTIKLLFWSILFSSVAIAQAPIYVKSDATGLNNGTSWADAFNSLQAAINSSVAGNEIWVAAGTYYPSEIPPFASGSNTNRDFTFTLKSNVKLFGGFIGNEIPTTENNTGSKFLRNRELTILSGDLGLANDDADNAYHVVMISNVVGAVLDGFTITNGNANGSTQLTVDIAITGNHPRNYGAGIFLRNSSAIIKNSIIIKNKAGGATCYGAGMFAGGTTSNFVDLEDVVFKKNVTAHTTGSGYSGGLFISANSNLLNKLTFIENSSSVFAGGFMVNNSDVNYTISNSVFYKNVSEGTINSGAGFYVQNGTANIINCTFYKNAASGRGGAIIATNSSVANIKNTILLDNTASTTANGNDFYTAYAGASIIHTIHQVDGVQGALPVTQSNNITTATSTEVFRSTDSTSPFFLHLLHSPDNKAIDAGDNEAYL